MDAKVWFDHEKLHAYQSAIAFSTWLAVVLDERDRLGDIKDQLQRAAASIALNIAEGNGRFGDKDRSRYFDIARSSALECAAGLDVLVARNRLTTSEVEAGKELLFKTVNLLMGLLKHTSGRNYDRAERPSK